MSKRKTKYKADIIGKPLAPRCKWGQLTTKNQSTDGYANRGSGGFLKTKKQQKIIIHINTSEPDGQNEDLQP